MSSETSPFNGNGPAWFEEDCDWSIVVVVFNPRFAAEFYKAGIDYAQAFNTLKNWHPDAFERFFGCKLTAADSFKRRQSA